jgi:hypothetical protein
MVKDSITDHQALVWLQQHKDHCSKLMHWILELQEYDFEIIHRPRDLSTNVDALSCLPRKDAHEAPGYEYPLPATTAKGSVISDGSIKELSGMVKNTPLIGVKEILNTSLDTRLRQTELPRRSASILARSLINKKNSLSLNNVTLIMTQSSNTLQRHNCQVMKRKHSKLSLRPSSWKSKMASSIISGTLKTNTSKSSLSTKSHSPVNSKYKHFKNAMTAISQKVTLDSSKSTTKLENDTIGQINTLM